MERGKLVALVESYLANKTASEIDVEKIDMWRRQLVGYKDRSPETVAAISAIDKALMAAFSLGG